MVFSSAAFLFVFLPVVFVLSRIVPGIRAKNVLLLIASFLFYAFGEPVYVLLMLFSTLINFAAGRLLAISGKGKDKLVVAAAVILNLGMLSVFKYTDFFLTSVNRAFSLEIPLTGIALPVGISFFTFQGLSYVIDVYRDRKQVAKGFVKLALYISFFPQLIAGPIVKYHDVAQQIDERQVSSPLTADGVRRFILGLSKKLLIANTVGHMADLVFSAGTQELDLRLAWLGALCYALQIYFDFSGYSDMAIGLGRMFGFRFLENFNYPYISGSVKEFWRRWHIPLTSFLRECVYIPLGGNRKGGLLQVRNILIVWLLTGIWHGASLNFLMWGVYFGILLLFEKFILKNILKKLPSWIQHTYACLLVIFGWVLFAFEDLHAGLAYLLQMLGRGGLPFSNDRTVFLLLGSLSLLVLSAFGSTPLPARLADRFCKKGRTILEPLFLGAVLFLSIAYLVDATYNPFLYFRF